MKATTLLLLLGAGSFIFFASQHDQEAREEEALHPTCKSNWKLCSDISDLMEHNSSLVAPGPMCQAAANGRAKYGEPKWPSIPFTLYSAEADFRQTGLMLLIEPDAQFQNGFGAWAHVRVTCVYNLSNQEVRSIQINQN